MNAAEIQQLCELGQNQLMRMEYLAAERTLAQAESAAWQNRDFDSLARLYMPLQESRRQRRQRAAEGRIEIVIQPDNQPNIENLDQGEFLIAGPASIEPAMSARKFAAEKGLYVDVFLAAVYPAGAGRIVAIVPTADVALPPADPIPIDQLIRRLPVHTIVIPDSELAKINSSAAILSLWEQLHAPFLAAATATPDPIRKIEAYRKTIAVDYACELAHQFISDLARKLCAKHSS